MTDLSMFDPNNFLSTEVTGELSTTIKPIPEMEEATLICKKIDVRVTGPQQEYVVMDITWVVDEPEARTATGLAEPTVRQGVFLDITEQGGLDMAEGANIDLGRVRAAAGQNDANTSWMPARLEGVAVVGQITQRASNKEGDDRIFNDVKNLRAA